MKLNSAQLEAFAAVARVANFTRAAEALGITQSALSQRISKLEADLEVTIFVRDRSAIRLTDAGEQLLRFCQLNESAESDLLARLKDSRDDHAGTLRIGGFSSVNRSLVIPALRPLLAKNPRLSLQLITRELRELDRLLKSAEVDYALTNRRSDSADVESVFLGYEDNVLVRAKRHPVSEIFLDHDESDPTTRAYFSQNKLKFKPRTLRYLDDVYGLLDGVKNGLGQAVLPLHLIAGERELEIVEPKRRLVVPVYFSFYLQPYYKRVHQELLRDLGAHFASQLRQH